VGKACEQGGGRDQPYWLDLGWDVIYPCNICVPVLSRQTSKV
ncbi:hypothetical protein C5167_045951, partial [Papaver somniferum]